MPAILGWVTAISVSRVLFLLRASCRAYVIQHYTYQFRALAVVIPWPIWCVPAPVAEAIRVASEAATSTLLGPIFPIALTLFYYDQRIRKEGYDIERMMDAAGLIAPAAPPAGESIVASVPSVRSIFEEGKL